MAVEADVDTIVATTVLVWSTSGFTAAVKLVTVTGKFAYTDGGLHVPELDITSDNVGSVVMLGSPQPICVPPSIEMSAKCRERERQIESERKRLSAD